MASLVKRSKQVWGQHSLYKAYRDDLIRLGRRSVMTCSVDMMVVVWLMVALFCVTVNYMKAQGLFTGTDWTKFNAILFLFIGITVVWVIFARSSSALTRKILFALWVVTLALALAWFAMDDNHTKVVFFFVGCVLVGLLISNSITSVVDLDTPLFSAIKYAIGGAFVVVIASIGAHTFSEKEERNLLYIALALSQLVVFSQLLATWIYVHHNESVWLVEDSCMFASMSPWEEAVNAFSFMDRSK